MAEATRTITTRPLKSVYTAPPAPGATVYDSAVAMQKPAGKAKFFFSTVQLNMQGLDLSFESAPEMWRYYEGLRIPPLKLIANIMDASVVRVHNAPITFSPVVLFDVFGDPATIAQPILKGYLRQALGPAMATLGSLKLLGAPVGVINDIRSAARADDSMLAPLSSSRDGVERTRTRRRGRAGVGTASSAALLSAAANVTSSASRGLAALLDRRFQDKHESSLRSGELAAGTKDGVQRGLRTAGRRIAEGVTGIDTFVDVTTARWNTSDLSSVQVLFASRSRALDVRVLRVLPKGLAEVCSVC